jgi:predicted RNase H-like HicB family nuclease
MTAPWKSFVSMVAAAKPGRKIVTQYAPPPIPDRTNDWMATFEDWDLGEPIGLGETEQDAIADLEEQIEQEEEDRRQEEQYLAETSSLSDPRLR